MVTTRSNQAFSQRICIWYSKRGWVVSQEYYVTKLSKTPYLETTLVYFCSWVFGVAGVVCTGIQICRPEPVPRASSPPPGIFGLLGQVLLLAMAEDKTAGGIVWGLLRLGLWKSHCHFCHVSKVSHMAKLQIKSIFHLWRDRATRVVELGRKEEVGLGFSSRRKLVQKRGHRPQGAKREGGKQKPWGGSSRRPERTKETWRVIEDKQHLLISDSRPNIVMSPWQHNPISSSKPYDCRFQTECQGTQRHCRKLRDTAKYFKNLREAQ